MSVFALNMDRGSPLETQDNGDGTCTLIVVNYDAANAPPPGQLGTFALKKDRGLPLKTLDNGDGTVSLIISAADVGNLWWIKSTQTITIGPQRENIVTSPMLVEGILIANGRLTVI